MSEPQSSDALAVEMASLDVTPESDRKGKPPDLLVSWLATSISVLGISWGSWILGFGLSLGQAVVVSVAGMALSFLVYDLIAITGRHGSTPVLVLSRAAFGFSGNRILATVSWILTVGWKTPLAIMAVQATAAVVGALGFTSHVVARIIALILVVMLATGSGILGFETIMEVQTWITWATAALTIVYLVLIAPTIDFVILSSYPSVPMTAMLSAGCMLLVGFGFGWVNATTDCPHYLPRVASAKGVVSWTTVGTALPTIILVFFGILLVGSTDESLSEAIGDDPIGALTMLLPAWFPIPFALVTTLGLIGGIVMDIYSSGLSLLATGVPVSRPVTTAIDDTVMMIGTIAIVSFADSFLTPFTAFLTTLGVVIAAQNGVTLADITLRHNGYDEPSLFAPPGHYGSMSWGAVASLIVGSLVGQGLVIDASASWLSWQSYLLGPLDGHNGDWTGTDIGILLVMVVGFVSCWVANTGHVRTQEEFLSRTYAEGIHEGE